MCAFREIFSPCIAMLLPPVLTLRRSAFHYYEVEIMKACGSLRYSKMFTLTAAKALITTLNGWKVARQHYIKDLTNVFILSSFFRFECPSVG